MTDPTIKLGAVELPIAPIPLGRLRKLMPAFNRAGRAFVSGQVDDAQLDDVFEIISTATGKPAAELEEIPGTFGDLMRAVDTIAEVAGLRPKKESSPGEALPGT